MTDTSKSSPPRRALSAGVWTAGERVISQISQLVVFIAAARILSPAEFGVFALTSACAILLLRVAEVGWAQYIMSWSGSSDVPRQVLLIAMCCGALMMVFGAVVGQSLNFIGFGTSTANLVTLFAFWVLLATTSSAQKGILIWQNKLRSSAVCEITGEIGGLIVALAALLSGFGVFALVFGRITMQTLHIIFSFSFTRLTPMRGLGAAQMKDLKTFSFQIFSSTMIINLRLYAATFIIGGFLGAAAVGYYRAAERLVGALAEVVGVPANVLAWSLFRQSREAHNGSIDGFQEQANSFFHVLVMASLPVFIWVSVLGQELIVGLLGPEWLPAFPVVMILAFARCLMMPGMAAEPILSLAGEIRRLPKFAICFLMATVGPTVAAGPYGMIAVAWSQVAVAVFISISMLWLMHTYGGIRWKTVAYRIRHLIVPISCATALLVFLRNSALLADFSPLLRIVAASVPVLAVYAILLSLLDPAIRKLALGRLSQTRAKRQGTA